MSQAEINAPVILFRAPADIPAKAWVAMVISGEQCREGKISESEDMENWMRWHDAAVACLDTDKSGIPELAAKRAEAMLKEHNPDTDMSGADFINSFLSIACNHIKGENADIDYPTPEILFLPFRGDAADADESLAEISHFSQNGWKMHVVSIMSDADALALGPTDCWRILNQGLGGNDNPLLSHEAEGLQEPGFALVVMEPIHVNDNGSNDCNEALNEIIPMMMKNSNDEDVTWMHFVSPAELSAFIECWNEMPTGFRDELLDYVSMAVDEGGLGTSAIIMASLDNVTAEVRMISPQGFTLDSMIFPCPPAGPTAMASILNEIDIAVSVENRVEGTISKTVPVGRKPNFESLRLIPGGKM